MTCSNDFDPIPAAEGRDRVVTPSPADLSGVRAAPAARGGVTVEPPTPAAHQCVDLSSATTGELIDELGRRLGELRLLPPGMGADIEILDDLWRSDEKPPTLKPAIMRVNGTDVGLIARDGGIQIDAGSDLQPTRVTVTLLPSSVTMRVARPDERR